MIPRWLEKARTYIGTKEIPGLKNSEVVMGWAAYLGGWVKTFYKNDEIAWCGLAAGALFKACGFPIPKNPLSALSYATWGVKLAEPALGAVLVCERSGGGNVGLYEGEGATFDHVLGGNQANTVRVSRIEKERCVAIRWPAGEPLPTGGRVRLTAGGAVSKNEA